MADNKAHKTGGHPTTAGAVHPLHGKGSEYMPKSKTELPRHERQARFGKAEQPIPATVVYRADIDRFSRKDVKAEKWIAVNDEAGTMTFINTYDGKTGVGYDMVAQTQPLDARRLAEKSKGYEVVDVDDCPVCISIEDAKKAKIPNPGEVAEEAGVGLEAEEGSARVTSEEPK